MAKKEVELWSKNAYAAYLGIAEKAVRNAIATGKIKKGWDAEKKKVIKHLADKEFGILHLTPKAQRGLSKVKVMDKIETRKSRQKAKQVSSKITSPAALKKTDLENLPVEQELLALNFNKNGNLQDVINSIQVTPYLTYADVLTKREIVGLAVDKIKLEELNGILVRKSEVEKALFVLADRLKKALLTIPARCADSLLNSKGKIEVINILTEELNGVLARFADFENTNLNINSNG